MGFFDQFLSKYGAVLLSYLIQALPIFGPERVSYMSKYANNPSLVARDYIRNAGLLVNLARAIGKIIGTYKDVQKLSGFTSLISELEDTLDDVKNGKFVRAKVKKMD